MKFKKTFKIIGRILLGFIAFIALYALAAYTLPKIGTAKEANASSDVAIYIHTNGVHTDVVLPITNSLCDWRKDIKFGNTISKDTAATLVAFGWGDKGFYLNTPTWSQLKFSVAFKAAFALSTSAMHTTFYKNLQEGDDCKKILISNEQYGRLIKYIRSSFKTDSNNNVINIKTNANYNNYDAFYEAKGRYNLFYTCNTWAQITL